MGKIITSIVTLTVAIILTYASTAMAGEKFRLYEPEKVERAYIKDWYVTKTIKTPSTTQNCREVDVPIYGNTGGSVFHSGGQEVLLNCTIVNNSGSI